MFKSIIVILETTVKGENSVYAIFLYRLHKIGQLFFFVPAQMPHY